MVKVGDAELGPTIGRLRRLTEPHEGDALQIRITRLGCRLPRIGDMVGVTSRDWVPMAHREAGAGHPQAGCLGTNYSEAPPQTASERLTDG
jgi:hypothetical protein